MVFSRPLGPVSCTRSPTAKTVRSADVLSARGAACAARQIVGQSGAVETGPAACRPGSAAAGRAAARRASSRPTATAAATPDSESSIATQSVRVDAEQLPPRAGTAPDRGLPLRDLVAGDDDVEGRRSRVGARRSRSAIRRIDIVTSAVGMPAVPQLEQQLTGAGTPRHVARRSASSTRSVSTSMISLLRELDAARLEDERRLAQSADRRAAGRPRGSRHRPTPRRARVSAIIQYGSVSTRVPSMSQSTAAGSGVVGQRMPEARECVTTGTVYGRGPILEVDAPGGRERWSGDRRHRRRTGAFGEAHCSSSPSRAGTTRARPRAAPRAPSATSSRLRADRRARARGLLRLPVQPSECRLDENGDRVLEWPSVDARPVPLDPASGRASTCCSAPSRRAAGRPSPPR